MKIIFNVSFPFLFGYAREKASNHHANISEHPLGKTLAVPPVHLEAQPVLTLWQGASTMNLNTFMMTHFQMSM